MCRLEIVQRVNEDNECHCNDQTAIPQRHDCSVSSKLTDPRVKRIIMKREPGDEDTDSFVINKLIISEISHRVLLQKLHRRFVRYAYDTYLLEPKARSKSRGLG